MHTAAGTAEKPKRKYTVSDKVRVANALNARGSRKLKTLQRLIETNELARLTAELRGALPECIKLAKQILIDRVYVHREVEVEEKDAVTGEVRMVTRVKRERVPVPLELRERVRQDIMDRAGMPKKSENDVKVVGSSDVVLFRMEGGLGWPGLAGEGSEAKDAQPASPAGANGADGDLHGGDPHTAH